MANIARWRKDLYSIYRAALTTVDGRACVRAYLRVHPLSAPVAVLALGKAAAYMAAGAFDALGENIREALVISKYQHIPPGLLPPWVVCVESAHPLPDAASLHAGAQMLDFLAALPPGRPLLCLLSGGASALAEVPAPGLNLADISRAHAWLLGNGLPIQAVNRVRKKLSAIKGGRLACYVRGRTVLNLLIADVVDNDVRAIASGLLTPHPPEDLPPDLPSWLSALLDHAVPEAETMDFAGITQAIVADSATLRQAALLAAQKLGYRAYAHAHFLDGDALDSGAKLAQYLCADAPSGVHIWCGETTVRLPPAPGRGGRCQSLALAAACQFVDKTRVCLLAAGSDGSDGPGEVAGALVDGATLQRGAGLDARAALARADAGTFLAHSGDLLYTGPTGTNVMDICLGIV
jgi:glycerate 2-kinase